MNQDTDATEVKGGKPNPGTKPDMRLGANNPRAGGKRGTTTKVAAKPAGKGGGKGGGKG